jgi:hypothetical protein
MLYSGTGKASMIHFVTDFTFRPGTAHKTASKQSLFELVGLGTREVKDATLIIPVLQPPRLMLKRDGAVVSLGSADGE